MAALPQCAAAPALRCTHAQLKSQSGSLKCTLWKNPLMVHHQQQAFPSIRQNRLAVSAAKGGAKKGKGTKFPKKVKAEEPGEIEGEETEESTDSEAEKTETTAPVAQKQVKKKEDDRLVVKASDPIDGKLQVQVTVPGNTTQAIYQKTLVEVSKTCPPVPGARMQKGGKSTKVDPAVVLRLIGQNKFLSFVVRECVNSTLASFVEERGLNAEKEAKTLQSGEELTATFVPGKPFSFDAEIVLLDAPAETPVLATASSE